jgi:hypothetical protein
MAGNDYAGLLRSTLEAARNKLLDQGQQAGSLRHQSSTALSHTEQALITTDDNLARVQSDAEWVDEIFKLAYQGAAMIKSASDLSQDAAARSGAAAGAMAAAATAIKTLADSYDTLAAQVAGVSAIARNDDAGTAVSHAADLTRLYANDAADTVERLKAASLNASIEAARSTSAAAASSVQALGVELEGLVARTDALQTSSTAKLAAAWQAAVAAQQAEKAALNAFHVAKNEAAAADRALTVVDEAVNGGLSVSPAWSADPAAGKAAGKGDALLPALLAKYSVFDLVAANAKSGGAGAKKNQLELQTAACLFFSVPKDEAGAFTFGVAKKIVAQDAADAEVAAAAKAADGGAAARRPFVEVPAKAGVSSYQATVFTDSNGVAIAPGKPYQVFVLRLPRQHGIAAARESDLSQPAQPVAVWKAPPAFDKQPISVKLADGTTDPAGQPPRLFSLGLAVPAQSGEAAYGEYRAIVVRADVYRGLHDVLGPADPDVEFFASLLNASYYQLLGTPAAGKQTSWSTDYAEGATDAFGDVLAHDKVYRALVLAVGKGPYQNELLGPTEAFSFKDPAARGAAAPAGTAASQKPPAAAAPTTGSKS